MARHQNSYDRSIQINLFRVAFLLERMCPLKYGLGSKFNETVSLLAFSTGNSLSYNDSILHFTRMPLTI
jgi:hypothetical protein